MFSAQKERLPGVEHCLHNPYKYLFFLYSPHSGVIVYSRVKRGTPTHLWNARSAFLWRTSCIPRREAKERVQLVSGVEIREFSTNINITKTTHLTGLRATDSGYLRSQSIPGAEEDGRQRPGQPEVLTLGHNSATMPRGEWEVACQSWHPQEKGPIFKRPAGNSREENILKGRRVIPSWSTTLPKWTRRDSSTSGRIRQSSEILPAPRTKDTMKDQLNSCGQWPGPLISWCEPQRQTRQTLYQWDCKSAQPFPHIHEKWHLRIW